MILETHRHPKFTEMRGEPPGTEFLDAETERGRG
jgi:hypothetical protein